MMEESPKKTSRNNIPDFIQKLYLMLENIAFKDIVSWDNSGTSFLIKDINDFTKIILPQHFKHCNFASFVRQLNKYDFHKIRNNKHDQVWQFKHDFFKRDRKDLLEEIKRKTTAKKDDVAAEDGAEDNDVIKDLRQLIKRLQSQIKQMKQSQQDLELSVEKMHKRDKSITSELLQFQQNLLKKDELLKQCIQLISANNNNHSNNSNNNSNPIKNDHHSLTHALDKLQQQQQFLASNKGKNKPILTGNWTTPPRVLLVDDDSVYRDVCGRMLAMMKCSVDSAKDGIQALEKLNVNKYDLILMDIMMPNMDGITTTRNIRRFDTMTPVVSMTSNFTQADIMEYINIGMNDILPKPFSKNTLYDILEKHCAHLKLPTYINSSTSTTPLLIEESQSTNTSPTTTPTHPHSNVTDYLTLNNRKRSKYFHNFL
ncbi:unnamed protein product [Rhizopus microsporus]|nr:hypothetical protein RMCBS344292_05312 [Rhizopus microsporus]